MAVASDGAVAFTRTTAQTRSLEVFEPTTDRSTVLAARFAAGDRVVVTGNVVAFWAAVDHDGIGELGVWTSADGVKRLEPRSLAGVFAASLDGSRVAFSSNAGAGRKGDLSVGTSRATPPIPVIRGAVAATEACAVRLEFVERRLFVASCGDGQSAPTVRTVSEMNESVTILSSAKSDWATDATGSKIFVVSSEGVGSVHTVPQNRATRIDGDVAWGQMGDDGNVVYRTNAGALKKATTSAPVSMRTLVAAGIRGVAAFSPDLAYALVSSAPPDAANQNFLRHDVQLRPIPPGMSFIPTPTEPMLLVASPTGLALGFTGNGDRAIYLADLPALGLPLGTLKAHAVEAMDPEEVVLARGVLTPKLLESRPGAPSSAKTSRILFADHPRVDGDRLVAVDVEIVDAETGTKSLVIQGVDPAFAATGTFLAYTVAGRGIFTAKLP